MIVDFVDETDTSFVFHMNHSHVQNARKRKGLNDYPGKWLGWHVSIDNLHMTRFANGFWIKIKVL